jgi:hypothetical protein
MLLATANVAKSAQICPKLPKTAQRQLVQETLKFHQKLRFWYFYKKIKKKKLPCVEGAPKHGHTIWIFIPSIFSYAYFLSKKTFYYQKNQRPF